MSEFYPTVMLTWFGEVLHQQWLSADGQSEWRPVPVVEVKPDRRPAVAGWVAEEDEEDEGG